MKCGFFHECEATKNLIVNIDLRVDQSVRIADVAKRLLPLNDKVGNFHVSANIAYDEEGQSKHTNLPAYAIETQNERIFCILFPTETYATIWQNPNYRAINLLEYHIDKHTEVITEVSDIANTNNQVIYGFPIEGGTEAGDQANVDASLLLPLTQLLQAIDSNIPTVVIGMDGYYVHYDIKHTPDGKSWQGIIGKTYFTEDSEGNMVYNNQYYQFTPNFEGKLNDTYTRFLKQRTLANKNNTIQKANLSISSKTATTNVIDNTAGTGVTLNTATANEAGLMGSEDHQRMTMLFDGSLLGKDTPAGYHKHNYLEMSDLPPIIEFAAASYDEFKAAVVKLQTEVISQGKFGRIIQTDNWTRTDDMVFDLTKIEITNPATRFIDVSQHPMKLTGRCTFEYLYLINLNAIPQDNKLMLEFIESNRYDFLNINNLFLSSAFGSTNTNKLPVIKLTGSTAVSLDIRNFKGANRYSAAYSKYPLCIETSAFSESVSIRLTNNEIPKGYKTYLKFANIPTTSGLNIWVDSSSDLESNQNITPYIKQLQKNFNDLDLISGLVPVPTSVQKKSNYFLNALGQWVDITTLIGR